MAKHVHETYTCDRCKADLGSELPKRNQGAEVSAAFNFRDGPGPIYRWVDLCDDCDRAVKAFFLPIAQLQPTGSERREAREAVQAMLQWANKEGTDYVCVLMNRIFGGKLTNAFKEERKP